VVNPLFGYLIPEPEELEKEHGMTDFRKRFNLLRYYSIEEIMKIAERDVRERTEYLKNLFGGESGEEQLSAVTNVWSSRKLPDKSDVKKFYEEYYG
jgi:hypothetical protein